VVTHATLGIAAAGVGQGARVDAESVLAGPVGGAVVVAGAFSFDAAVNGVTLVAARAEADGVVVGGLADGIGSALGGLARVSAASGDAGFASDAVLIAETSGCTDATDTVEAVVTVPGAEALLKASPIRANLSTSTVNRYLARSEILEFRHLQ